MKITLVSLVMLAMAVVQLPVFAGQVEIKHVQFAHQSDGWRADVTLLHNDTGWNHYADAWRVVDVDGKVLATRKLLHPHEHEQPFTRSLSGIQIPAGIHVVFVEAHDKVHGWSKDRVRVDLSRASGPRYQLRH